MYQLNGSHFTLCLFHIKCRKHWRAHPAFDWRGSFVLTKCFCSVTLGAVGLKQWQCVSGGGSDVLLSVWASRSLPLPTAGAVDHRRLRVALTIGCQWLADELISHTSGYDRLPFLWRLGGGGARGLVGRWSWRGRVEEFKDELLHGLNSQMNTKVQWLTHAKTCPQQLYIVSSEGTLIIHWENAVIYVKIKILVTKMLHYQKYCFCWKQILHTVF